MLIKSDQDSLSSSFRRAVCYVWHRSAHATNRSGCVQLTVETQASFCCSWIRTRHPGKERAFCKVCCYWDDDFGLV